MTGGTVATKNDTPAEATEAEAIAMDEFQVNATIHQRLAAILAELPSIGKDARNTQQNFDYRSHDAVLNALNPLMSKYGVFVVPDVIERQVDTRKTSGGSTMYEVNLRVAFAFYGPLGDNIVATAWGEGTDMGDKSTNKATTMAFKNVLAVVFAIATAEYDTDAASPEETVRDRPGAQERPPGGRQRASTRQQRGQRFDPGKQLLDGAIQLDGDYWRNVGLALQEIGPTTDWRETLRPVLRARFVVEERTDLTEEQSTEYAIRMSNAIQKLRAEIDTTAFPPVESTDPDKVEAALQWAFATDVPVPLAPDVEKQLADEAAEAAAEDSPNIPLPTGDDDVPFGEPEKRPQGEHRDPTA